MKNHVKFHLFQHTRLFTQYSSKMGIPCVPTVLVFSTCMLSLITHAVTRRVKKDIMLSANTVLRYRSVKFVKNKENNRNIDQKVQKK